MEQDGSGLAGRYVPDRRIGWGGMADVYVGTDTLLRRRVAIKLLTAESKSDPQYVERFRREAQAIAQVSHPNVVAVYDWGSWQGTYYMVMEYVEGQTLKERLRGGPLPESDALTIAIQVTSALQVAHEHGIIHRDIKPQNILLGPHGQVKVVDFGIAHTVGSTHLTQTNAVSGTAHYLSPEQARGKDADSRSDIYSLGVVLYEMVTGVEPFTGSSLVEVAMRHVHDEPVPAAQRQPALSPLTGAVIARAMAKDPDRRYGTAAALGEALRQAQEGLARPRPVETERTLVAPGPRASRQQPANRKYLLALVPAAALVAGAAAAAFQHSPSFGSSAHVAANQRLGTPTSTPGTRSPHRTGKAAATARARVSAPSHVSAIVPTATPRPTSSSSPPTRSAAVMPTAAAVTPPPASTAAQPTGSDSPEGAVNSFYANVAGHNYAAAQALWTADMINSHQPVSAYIQERWQGTQSIKILGESATSTGPNSATVSIHLLDQETGESGARDYVGTWYTVKQNGTWLLESGNFTQVNAGGAPPAKVDSGNKGQDGGKDESGGS